MSFLSSDFDTGTYTVNRTAGDATIDDAGHTIMPATTVVPGGVTGSLQPFTGTTLQDLKEGKRADDRRYLFTETPLYTTIQKHAAQDFVDVPDEVDPTVIQRYRVIKVEWFGVISGHYRVTLEKVTLP